MIDELVLLTTENSVKLVEGQDQVNDQKAKPVSDSRKVEDSVMHLKPVIQDKATQL